MKVLVTNDGQTLLTLMEIASQLKRIADRLDANDSDKPRRRYERHTDEVSIDAIFRELGIRQNRDVFNLACKKTGITPTMHNTKSKRLYIPSVQKGAVIQHIKRIVG